jgi:hypothetical protein
MKMLSKGFQVQKIKETSAILGSENQYTNVSHIVLGNSAANNESDFSEHREWSVADKLGNTTPYRFTFLSAFELQ